MQYYKSDKATPYWVLTQPSSKSLQYDECKSGQIMQQLNPKIIICQSVPTSPDVLIFTPFMLVEGRQEERGLVVIRCSAPRDLSFVYSCDLNLYCVCIVLRSQSTEDRRLFRIRASKHIDLWALLSKEVLCSHMRTPYIYIQDTLWLPLWMKNLWGGGSSGKEFVFLVFTTPPPCWKDKLLHF